MKKERQRNYKERNEHPSPVGVIGGSGLYGMKGLTEAREVAVKTPFGKPSSPIILGKLGGVDCAFLARHGKGHVLLPGEINGRANIWALKSLGVRRIIGVAAVGSLREELVPRHFVFPDQIVDETKGRRSTFFGDGCVAHTAFAHPFCPELRKLLFKTSESLGITSHWGGVYACMEGPQFSTRAESEYHRAQGYSLIGMTVVPEAKLAREAELCYATVALVTDYDCWKDGEEVTNQVVIANLTANVENAQRLIAATASAAAGPTACACGDALAGSIFTNPAAIPPKTRKALDLIVGKYLKK